MLIKILILFIVLGSCKTISEENSFNNLRHAKDNFTNNTYSWLYQEPSEEFLNLYLQTKYGSNIKRINNELSERLENWFSAIHMEATILEPFLRKLPAPKLVVLDSPIQNAFNDSMPICIKADIVFDNGKERFDDFSLNYSLSDSPLVKNKHALSSSYKSRNCVLISPPLEEVASYINEKNLGCNVSVKEKRLYFPKECTKAEVEPGIYNTLNLMVNQSVITITTSLLKETADEREAVFVLAHELAHYYKAHYSYKNFYNYFYKNSPKAHLVKPEPISTNEGELALQDAYSFKFFNAPGAQIHSGFFQTVRSLSNHEKHCESNECKTSCKDFKNYMNSDSYKNMVAAENCGFICASSTPYFPYINFDNKHLETYKNFEEKALICSEQITLFDKPDLLESLWAQLADRYLVMSQSKTSINVKEMLLKASNFLFIYDNIERPKNYLALNSQKLGFYTMEQEADEIALNLLSLVGVSYKHAVNFELEALKSVQKSFYDVPYEDCLPYITEAETNPYTTNFPPIGNLSSPYHNHCTRVFNLIMEGKNHDYPERSPALEILSKDLWKSLIDR